MHRLENNSIRNQKHSLRSMLFLAATVLLLTTGSASAGTICGTIRDGMTAGLVARAGVFVRLQTGEYTGYHGATDESGNFCIDDIPAGTYDLEVKVDDYAVGYIRGVEVTDDVTSVEHDLTDLEFFFAPPWPNPAQGGTTFRFRTGRNIPVRLVIYDPAGRVVRGWSDFSGSTGNRSFAWDLRNRNGLQVPSGIYFARLSAGDVNLVRSIVILK